MPDLPPPYSLSDLPQPALAETQDSNFAFARYVGRIQITTPIQTLAPTYLRTNDYCHRHDVYLTAITSQDAPPESTLKENVTGRSINTIHFWTPDHSSSKFAPVSEEIESDLLSMVQGFQNCGSFEVSRKEGQADRTEYIRQLVHEQLAHYLLDSRDRGSLFDPVDNYAVTSPRGMEKVQPQRDNSAMIPSNTESNHISGAHSVDPNQAVQSQDGDWPMAHLYKIHMFSKDAEFIDPVRGEDLHLLFKWARPRSAYGSLSGFWEVNLINVINDGMLRAGGQLMLMVRGVSDQQMEDLRACW